MREYDYLVIGSGIAGLSFALKAARHGSVAVLTKKRGEDSNTSWAQGGICCVSAPEDSFDSHVADTLDAGAGLCDEEVVRMIVEAGPAAIEELVRHGVDFDRGEDGGYNLGKEGGHSHRRILHAKDTTGKEIIDSLLAAARAEDNIDLLEDHFVVDLITTAKLGFATGDDRCIGLYALDQADGKIVTFRSDRVLLCTGGSGRVYLYTTNPEGATGDGVAMAWRAGAAISDMEFSQFHPTCLYHHERKSFLISEAVRGEGGVLIGQDGEEFMQHYDRRKSLAPRDIVARAIDREIKRTGGPCVFVDITHKPDGFMEQRFPLINKTCLEVGIDPVGIAVRPDGREVWVANHVSDSVSVIDSDPGSPTYLHVIATVQDFDTETKATRFDEPVGIAFARAASTVAGSVRSKPATLTPSASSRKASSRPMPLPAPVIYAVFHCAFIAVRVSARRGATRCVCPYVAGTGGAVMRRYRE